MTLTNKLGRTLGIILLINFVGGILMSVYLTAPLTGTPGFLENGAQYSFQIGLAALLSLGLSGLMLAFAILAFDTFQKHCRLLAISFLTLSIIGVTMSAIENMSMMSLVSYSKAYANVATTAEKETFEMFKFIVSSVRNWAHYTNLVFTGVTLFFLFSILFRFSMVPRVISGFGLLAVISQLISVTQPFLGNPVIFEMLAPMALSYLALISWLLIKGISTENDQKD